MALTVIERPVRFDYAHPDRDHPPSTASSTAGRNRAYPMPLVPGSRFGAYEIVSALGVGGMGEVYRGRDAKLHRDVAIKVLREDLRGGPVALARLAREAQVLASLNHPHIAAIYGVEESAGGSALVLELVEGETLADRIARGPFPLEEALAIARQIADALRTAHEQGIVHRDLKPANVKLRPDGVVKVLDFGLAKSVAPPGVAAAPSRFAHAHRRGLDRGRASSSARRRTWRPSRRTGKPADKRSDVWAFGCVLYEMLTGRRAFAGGWRRGDAGRRSGARSRLVAACRRRSRRRSARSCADA